MERRTNTRYDVGDQEHFPLRALIRYTIRKSAPSNTFISAPPVRELKRTAQGQFIFAPQGLIRLGIPHRLAQQDDSYPKGSRQRILFDLALRILRCACGL